MIKNLFFASIITAFTVTTASANTFVESDTKANLVGSGEDEVLTVVRVGKEFHNAAYGIGGGYSSLTDEAVIVGKAEYYDSIGRNIWVAAEVDVVYGTESDKLELQPQLRIRKYF